MQRTRKCSDACYGGSGKPGPQDIRLQVPSPHVFPPTLRTSTRPRTQPPERLCNSGPGLVAERETETMSTDLLCCCAASLSGGGV